MGQMRFVTPRREELPAGAVERAYLAGIEGIPWRSRNLWSNGLLTVERLVHESGNLYIPWSVEGHGDVTLSTASLMEREAPYELPVELARGTLNRVRNFTGEFAQAGFELSASLNQRLREAQRTFIEALTSRSEVKLAFDLSQLTVKLCLDAIDQLVDEGTRLLLDTRRQHTTQLPTLLAGNLDRLIGDDTREKRFATTFNSASVPMCWRDIEPNTGKYIWDEFEQRILWCHRQGLRICAGPLLRLDRVTLPDWVYLWEDDFDQLQTCVTEFVRAAARRFSGKVHIWHVAAGINIGGELDLTEEQRLRLAVGAIEVLRRTDPQTPLIISFDQPWAEYLARDDYELSPLHFADALARTDLGLAGIGLEMNLGFWPDGTLPRDLLEISRQIDRWSCLNLPLLVVVTAPSRTGPDPHAWRKTDVVASRTTELQTPAAMQQAMERLAMLLIAKPAVHGVVWNQLTDAEPHAFPHGGLFDAQGKTKPVLAALATVRQKYLT